MERGCIDCGYNSHPAALHFDHKFPNKKRFKIGAATSRNWTDVLKEIRNCDIRCANCHAVKTVKAKDHKRRKGFVSFLT